jgi:hypothetical protein
VSLRIVAAALAVVLAPTVSAESGYPLLSAGVQVRIGETTVIGQRSPDSFAEYDLRGHWRTPYESQLSPKLSLGARLLGGIGVFKGSGKTGAIASLIPVIALGTPDGRYTFDAGLGLGVLSRYRYQQQDFGGYLQFALTVGLEAPLYRRIGITYRFMHYSDAGSYGPHTVGADLHMAGLMYRF